MAEKKKSILSSLKVDEQGNYLYPLKKPIKGEDGARVSAISLREVIVKDIVWMDKADDAGQSTQEVNVGLIARLSGLAPPVIELFGLKDYNAIGEILGELLGNDEEDSERSESS